jgi:chemotaxis protein CheD
MLPELERALPVTGLERPVSYATLKTPGIAVGMGEARVVRDEPGLDPDMALVAYGLGSCVAVCLWDPNARVAGMAHVVLPGEDPDGRPNPKFARSALPALMALMRAQGATVDPRRLVARVAGGALVLTINAIQGIARIGDANAQAVLEVLAEAGVPVAAGDLGGPSGRSVWFDPRDGGRIRVRAIGGTDHYL